MRVRKLRERVNNRSRPVYAPLRLLRTSLGMWRDSLSDGLRSVLHRSPERPPVGYYVPMSWAGDDLLEDRAFHRWIDSNLGTNGAVAAVELTHHLEVLLQLQLSVWGIA